MRQTLSTRALLACGVLAGPIYLTVTLIEALTRAGFDPRQHRFSWLTAGDLGWIHQSNMVLVGVLTVLFAVGASQFTRKGRGSVWGPRLLGLLGAVTALAVCLYRLAAPRSDDAPASQGLRSTAIAG
jgi:hypothetical protein